MCLFMSANVSQPDFYGNDTPPKDVALKPQFGGLVGGGGSCIQQNEQETATIAIFLVIKYYKCYISPG